jgi:hypothetical protein
VRDALLPRRPGLTHVAGAAAAATVVGLLVIRSPLLAALAIAALAVSVAWVRFGAVAVVIPAFGLLPWLVIFEGLLPTALGTFTAAVAAGSLLYLVAPLSFDSPLIPVAAFGFAAIVLCHAVFATEFEELIQAAKYMVFPAVILAVTSERGREVVPTLKMPVLGSCMAAMVAHLGVIAAGAGATSTYYGAGEKLGFAGHGPHPLALMSMIIAAAGLSGVTGWLRVPFFGLGAVPAALTGVRSALLGIAVMLLVYIYRSPAKMRALAVLAGIALIALATGALDVVGTRFATHPQEFSSFSSAGSGRGEIWTVALNAWNAAGPWAWVFGTGLGSIVRFELAALGIGLSGHSDIVEVLVQIGFLGFLGWVALWIGLLRARLQPVVLLPIIVFGVVNGSLEYVAPLTAGIFLAAACVDPPPAAPAI